MNGNGAVACHPTARRGESQRYDPCNTECCCFAKKASRDIMKLLIGFQRVCFDSLWDLGSLATTGRLCVQVGWSSLGVIGRPSFTTPTDQLWRKVRSTRSLPLQSIFTSMSAQAHKFLKQAGDVLCPISTTRDYLATLVAYRQPADLDDPARRNATTSDCMRCLHAVSPVHSRRATTMHAAHPP